MKPPPEVRENHKSQNEGSETNLFFSLAECPGLGICCRDKRSEGHSLAIAVWQLGKACISTLEPSVSISSLDACGIEALGSGISTLNSVAFPHRVLWFTFYTSTFFSVTFQHTLTHPTHNVYCLFPPEHRMAATNHKTSKMKIPPGEIRNGVLCFGAPLPCQLTEQK